MVDNKPLKMRIGAKIKDPECLGLFLVILRLKQCVNMKLKSYHLQQNMFLINIRLSKYV